MRIWDISAGYLNRQSLLGEHRELHGLHSILVNGKRGYSRHPETLRWVRCASGLARRHALLVAEMDLRGYTDRTPIAPAAGRLRWPDAFVTAPLSQFELLRTKYRGREPGRIALPRSAHELWAQHKYSVMARDQAAYRAIGRSVARMRRAADASALAEQLVLLLRETPARSALVNALEHMWGYVSRSASAAERAAAHQSPRALLARTRELAVRERQPYLMAATALSELAAFA